MRAFLSLLLLIPPAAGVVPPSGAATSVTRHTERVSDPVRDSALAPLSPAATRKAEALLRDHLPCLGCHTLDGTGGKIGPDLSSVRTRRSPEYIAAMVTDPLRVVPTAAMPRPLLPASTRALLIRYLANRPGTATAPVPVPAPVQPAASAPDGAALYAKWCAACHGTSGKGDGPNAASLPIKPAAHSDREAMARRPDDSLYDTIAGGGEIMNRNPRMPAFGGSLSPAEIRALVAHIRTLCRCQGPSWSRDGAGAR